MKKILSYVLCFVMCVMAFPVLPAMAEETWTAESYTADFTNKTETDTWKNISGTNMPVIENGIMKLNNGATTQYILPVKALKNFVFETEYIHTSGDNYFGILFNVNEDFSNVGKYKLRYKSKITRADLCYNGKTRDTSEECGYQWTVEPHQISGNRSDLYQNVKVRVVVYGDKLAAWYNDQLIYSWTMDENYTGGYIGIDYSYYAADVRSLSVREATADDLVFAESFNAADTDTSDKVTGDFENTLLGGGNSGKIACENWGSAKMALAGGTAVFIDKNKNITGDHVYSAGFTLGSSNNGSTRYIAPLFGMNGTPSETAPIGENNTAFGVSVKIDGTVEVNKITWNGTGFSYSNIGSASGSSVRAKFPDKLGMIGENKVLKLDSTWEYRHVLNNGTLNIYLDDVLVLSVTKDILKDVSGYIGLLQNGFSSKLHYFAVRGVESADNNRPNKIKARLGDANGEFETLGEKIIRLYTVETTVDENTQLPVIAEKLYGTAYTDVNGMFDMELGNGQAYVAKLYSSGDGEPVAASNVTYQYTGEVFNLDFMTDADFSVLFDVSFEKGEAIDSSTNANAFTFYEQATTKSMEAFGGKEALVLDGVSDTLKFNNAGAMVLGDVNCLTAEAVFIPRERDGIKQMAVLGGRMSISASKKSGYGIYVDQDRNGNDIISFRISTGTNVLNEVNAPCEINNAYYVAGVYDGTSMKLYINGSLAAAKAVSGEICNIDSITPAIGAEWYFLNDYRKYFFKGEIANVKVTNGARTETDIAAVYNEYVNAGYKLGNEVIEDITAKVTFSNEEPVKGDIVTVNAAVRNNADTDKTVIVKMKPGYFAASVDGVSEQKITVPAKSTVNTEFKYKMLAGGREPFRAYVYEDGAEVAYDSASLSVIGAGYYKSETHNHSTRSDGTNTYEENVLEGFATKNLSYAFSTEHNQYNYWNYKKALDTSAMYNPKQFVVFATAGEYTTPQGHMNIYELDNDVTTSTAGEANQPFWNEASRKSAYEYVSENGAATAAGWNKLIDLSVREQGGYLYINHPSDPTYYTRDELIKDMRGFTGIEVWNGAQTCFDSLTMKQRDTWDMVNSQGWGHVIGQTGTDAHSSVAYGTIQKVAYIKELSHDEIVRVVADGNAISTNGPEIRFDINGAPLNGTSVVKNGKAVFNIYAYDPMGDILEVKLVKNIVSGEFTTKNREEIILYEKTEGADAIASWKYNEVHDVTDGEFYRVEVTTAKTPYGSVQLNGTTTQGEGSNMGWAFTNNIWIKNEGTNNSTNISEITINSDTIELSELATGILYLKGDGRIALSDIKVVSDGKAVVTNDGDLITVTVTADDGTVNKKEIYTVGNITVAENADEPKTTINCNITEKTNVRTTSTVTIDDEEGLIEVDGAVVVMAVYCDDVLVGIDFERVTAADNEKNLTADYPEQTDANALTVKVMLVKDLNSMKPLVNAVTPIFNVK